MKRKPEKETLVIDASSSVVGRIASYAAKQALLGKDIAIVNCDDAILTGRRRMIIDEYGISRRRGGLSLKGPFFPKHPERVMKRTVRGMLNYQQGRGLQAFKRIMCYSGVPKEYENSKKISLSKTMRTKTLSLLELSRDI